MSKYIPFSLMSTANLESEHPNYGASGEYNLWKTPPRLTDTDPESLVSNLSSARLLSNLLNNVQETSYTEKFISELLPQWGLQLHLDISLTNRNSSVSDDIKVPKGDLTFDPNGSGNETIPFSRTVRFGETNGKINLENTFTPFIDVSEIYGNGNYFGNKIEDVRLFKDGLLKSLHNETGEFPLVGNNEFIWSVPNTNVVPVRNIEIFEFTLIFKSSNIFATLFLREHNRKARNLKKCYNETWTDEEIFQKSRRWTIAVKQKITYEQYLPILLGSPLEQYVGYNSSVNPAIDTFFSTAAMRYGHSAVNTIIYRINENNSPYSGGHLLLRDVVYKNYADILRSGIEVYLRGAILQPEQVVDLNYVEDLRSSLPFNNPYGFDLLAVTLQRARDIGLCTYNEARKAFGLPVVTEWSDLTTNIELQEILKKEYKNVNNIEAFIGGLIENDGVGTIGPLFRASIGEQFTRIRDGDPYFYLSGILDEEDTQDLKRMTLGSLINLNTIIKNFPDNPFILETETVNTFSDNSRKATKIPYKVSFTMDYLLDWSVSEGSITFTVTTNYTTGWFAFGLGKTMNDMDIYFFTKNNGSWNILNAHSQFVGFVDFNEISNINNFKNINPESKDGPVSLQFSRPLVSSTISPTFKDIVNGTQYLSFAYNLNGYNLQYHGPSQRGNLEVDFLKLKQSIIEVVSVSVSSSRVNTLIMHGVLMFISFGFLYPAGIYVARYHTNLRTWLDIHQALMSIVTSNTVVIAITALVTNAFSGGLTAHSICGLVMIGTIVFVSLTGFMSFKISTRFTIKYTLFLRNIHKIIGFGMYFLGVVNGYLGCRDLAVLADLHEGLPLAYLVIIIYIPAQMISFAEYEKRKILKNPNLKISNNSLVRRKPSNGFNPSSANLPVFEWNEINVRVESGAKWIIIYDTLYDVQKVFDRHPGGKSILLEVTGIDATNYFEGFQTGSKNSQLFHKHSRLARFMLEKLAVGKIALMDEEKSDLDLSRPTLIADEEKGFSKKLIFSEKFVKLYRTSIKKKFLTVEFYRDLESKTLLTEGNSKRPVYSFIFSFPDQNSTLKIKPGEYFNFRYITSTGAVITRSYCPINCINQGSIEFMIKMYDGDMTRHLLACNSINLRGPLSGVPLLCHETEDGCWDNLGLIAGGTGLTPCLQLINYHLLNSKRDATTNMLNSKIHLLNVNNTYNDIFAKQLLSDCIKKSGGSLQITQLLKVADHNYEGLVGDIDSEIVKATMPLSENKTCIVVSGPASFTNLVVEILETEGFTKDKIRKL
ncbi:Peroxidase mlt-7 [Lobulomyces angularis]|nr:Peroxidase mlt-7 [Lobulomyces angularis]